LRKKTFPLEKIISGGQTGADRAGLEAGRRLGYATGGTAPKGFMTAKGPDPTLKVFGVVEHASSKYPPRTIANALNSDGTVWFGNEGTPGGKLTLSVARRAGKHLIVNPDAPELRQWILEKSIHTLNVAGDREENDPGIQERVEQIVTEALAERGEEQF
jgi:hypothetical protein